MGKRESHVYSKNILTSIQTALNKDCIIFIGNTTKELDPILEHYCKLQPKVTQYLGSRFAVYISIRKASRL